MSIKSTSEIASVPKLKSFMFDSNSMIGRTALAVWSMFAILLLYLELASITSL